MAGSARSRTARSASSSATSPTTEHALVDFRLYLPREWANDSKRRKKAGVPKDVRYRTRHELALEMLERRGRSLPHGWIAGDDEMGRPAWFRQRLAADGERYLLAVPSNTTIRDLEASRRPYGGRGRHPKAAFRGVRSWCEALPAEAWTKLTVRDGEKGPLEVEIVARRVESKVDRRVVGFEETLVVVRYEETGVLKHDYHLSNAAAGHAAGGVRAGGQGGAPDRGVSEACQERGGPGGVPGAELAWAGTTT